MLLRRANEHLTDNATLAILERAHITEIASGIRLAIIPRFETDWPTFIAQVPNRSVALDGFVKGPPMMDLARSIFNFNHHEGVQRWITFCTSQQVDTSLKCGLYEKFLLREETPDFTIFKNDPDPDSAFSSHALAFNDIYNSSRMLFNKLLFLVSEIDISGATRGPKIQSQLMREGAWIFEPYYKALKNNLYDMDGEGIASVLTDQHSRISDYLTGKGSEGKVDTRHDSLYDGESWSMIQEKGPFARLKVIQKRPSIDGIVILKGESKAGYRYSAAKTSHLAKFPVPVVCDIFNRIENILRSSNNEIISDSLSSKASDARNVFWNAIESVQINIRPWGGGDAIIGCLRENGSKINPALMPVVVNKIIAEAIPHALYLESQQFTTELKSKILGLAA